MSAAIMAYSIAVEPDSLFRNRRNFDFETSWFWLWTKRNSGPLSEYFRCCRCLHERVTSPSNYAGIAIAVLCVISARAMVTLIIWHPARAKGSFNLVPAPETMTQRRGS
jgi:hypothetical protein